MKIVKLLLLLILPISCLIDEDTKAHILFNEGKLLEQEQMFDSAAITYLKAVALSEEEGVAPLTGKIYNRLGDLYVSNNLFDEALSAYKEAVKYNVPLADKLHASQSYRGIGKCYLYTDRSDSAIAYFSKALRLLDEVDYKDEISSIYNNLSSAYYNLKDYDLALRYNTLALQMDEDSAYVYMDYFARGDIMAALQKHDSAQYYYLLGTRSDFIETKAGCYFRLSELSKVLGSADSVNYMKCYVELCDSIAKMNQSTQIQSLAHEYHLEQVVSEEEGKRWLLFLILFAIGMVVAWFLHRHAKNRLRHEHEKQDEERYQSAHAVEALRKEISAVEKELAQLKEEKDKEPEASIHSEALERLAAIQEKIMSNMEKYATNCTKDFVKSMKYRMIKKKLKEHPSILPQQEQLEVANVVNETFRTFIRYLSVFTEMPSEDCLLCCLALCRFTTKECSFIRGVSSEAIRSQRSRIKRRITDTFQSTALFDSIFMLKGKVE